MWTNTEFNYVAFPKCMFMNIARNLWHSISNSVFENGSFSPNHSNAFAPPRSFGADFFRTKKEAFCLHDIKEQFANKVRRRCSAHFKTRVKPLKKQNAK